MSPIEIEPALRQALEDVARAPGESRLFAGLSADQVANSFLIPDQTASIAKAGLMPAERYILAVHREELAFVLNQAFLTNHYASPDRDSARFHDGELLSHTALSKRANRVRDIALPGAYKHGTIRFLAKLCAGEPIRERNELASLTIASMRLVDSYRPRVYYALAPNGPGHVESAIRAAHHLLETSGPEGKAYLMSTLRFLVEQQGQLAKAFELGKQASRAAQQVGLEGMLVDELVGAMMCQLFVTRQSHFEWVSEFNVDRQRVGDRMRRKLAALGLDEASCSRKPGLAQIGMEGIQQHGF